MTGLLKHHFRDNSSCFCGSPQADGPGVVLGWAQDRRLVTLKGTTGMKWWSCLTRHGSAAKLAELEEETCPASGGNLNKKQIVRSGNFIAIGQRGPLEGNGDSRSRQGGIAGPAATCFTHCSPDPGWKEQIPPAISRQTMDIFPGVC